MKKSYRYYNSKNQFGNAFLTEGKNKSIEIGKGDISEIRMAYKISFAIFSVIVKCIYSKNLLYEVYIKICSLLLRLVNICPNSSSVKGFTYTVNTLLSQDVSELSNPQDM